MRLRVENLGPLREAEVDLTKNLVIFAGPNNTGKTYLAWAIYGFERFELTEELPSFKPVLDALIADPDEPQSLADIITHGDYIRELGERFTRKIADEYAGQREHFTHSRVALELGEELATTRPTSVFLPWEHETLAMSVLIDDTWTVTMSMRDRNNERKPASDLPQEARRSLLRPLARGLQDVVRFALRQRQRTTVFPVERLAINTFAKELTERRTSLVDRLRNLAAHGSDTALAYELAEQVERYPRAISDSLQEASRLDRYRRSTSPFADLADELETSILGGHIVVNEDSVLEFTPARATGTHLRIQQSASVVKSLASLVFHLRHRARPDERLIIDEPELNLHPDNQRKVARILAKLVNRGIQLIISTHSDYLIRELNNLIMLSQESDAARELTRDLGLQPEMLLTPDKLGVYLFRPDGSCTSVPVTETGFEVETIDDEVHKLNLDAQTIYSRLFLEE